MFFFTVLIHIIARSMNGQWIPLTYINFSFNSKPIGWEHFLWVESDGRSGLFLVQISDPRTWELAAPTTLPYGSTHNQARRVGVSPIPPFDFRLSFVEPRWSKMMFLSTSCQSGGKQTTNLKSPSISYKILLFFLWYF